LSLVNGAFSERFARIAAANGREVEVVEVPWGQVVTAEMVADRLRQSPDVDAVTVVHSETSTGALTEIEALAGVVHEAGDVVLLVDSVTGVGGAPVESDAWSLDFVLTGSQKALALPPGLALGVAQPTALARAEMQDHRGVYFDLLEFESNIIKHQTPNTPALSLLYALRAQLERIDTETVAGRWQRHDLMARRTWEWVAGRADRGLAILAPEGARSPTVTSITLPSNHTGPAVTAALKERGFVIGTGYGKLKETAIRIGHMGDHTVAELDALLEALGEVLDR